MISLLTWILTHMRSCILLWFAAKNAANIGSKNSISDMPKKPLLRTADCTLSFMHILQILYHILFLHIRKYCTYMSCWKYATLESKITNFLLSILYRQKFRISYQNQSKRNMEFTRCHFDHLFSLELRILF